MGDITIRTWIDAPVERCFDLARDVGAHVESASFSGERLVPPGKMSGVLEVGDVVCFEGRHAGFRQRFCARITFIDRPRVFVDEQESGFFRALRHTHWFSPLAGGTLMTDHLVWRAPLGALMDVVFMTRHMTWFVKTKQLALKRIAEGRTQYASFGSGGS
jgi:hypothetical protein